MTEHDSQRSRPAIRRVLALPPEQLPPGPSPTISCPQGCGAQVWFSAAALDKHRAEHQREAEREKRKRRKQTQRENTKRLQHVNRLRKEARQHATEPDPDPEPDQLTLGGLE